MMTLSRISEQLVDGDDARYRVSRKIQNWVTAGLVRPASGSGTGRGVHRLFDVHEVRKIAVLLELEQYQLPWSVLSRVADLFDAYRIPDRPVPRGAPEHRPARRRMPDRVAALLEQAVEGTGTAYLIMLPGKEIQVSFSSSPEQAVRSRSAVIVNLTEVLQRFR